MLAFGRSKALCSKGVQRCESGEKVWGMGKPCNEVENERCGLAEGNEVASASGEVASVHSEIYANA